MDSENRPAWMLNNYEGALDKQRQMRGPYLNIGAPASGFSSLASAPC
jgi:hypothetical protein